MTIHIPLFHIPIWVWIIPIYFFIGWVVVFLAQTYEIKDWIGNPVEDGSLVCTFFLWPIPLLSESIRLSGKGLIKLLRIKKRNT